jgi:hypothetical protein
MVGDRGALQEKDRVAFTHSRRESHDTRLGYEQSLALSGKTPVDERDLRLAFAESVAFIREGVSSVRVYSQSCYSAKTEFPSIHLSFRSNR